ncbi:universal stress protein [Acinetobacter defluvii]|uniref:Universal stress protein n=1 Tax=Acinetobacter defluvii TaxID=1871111 RepID=A0A2S2FDL6_9GAMM|nr:universal stress protein [Acinetobacter defluvii]AWL29066.1 universal stress protein [Acinetobacter defluvii]NNP72178.1 universal stress protein [Acinetobacter defluvii]
MSYEHILVPVDESPISYAALKHAEELALSNKSKVTVVSVLAVDPMFGVDFYQVAPSITEYVLAAEKNAQARLNDIKTTLNAHGVTDVTTKIVREVSPATGILNTLNEIDADLIVMGSHGRKGLKKFVLGSVAQEVLGESFVPVLIVKQ